MGCIQQRDQAPPTAAKSHLVPLSLPGAPGPMAAGTPGVRPPLTQCPALAPA